MEDLPQDIAHSIELAVAPVFLIAGIGALLTVLTNRLGRVVDRSRALEIELSAEGAMEAHPRWRAELWLLDRRISWINRAIVLSTAALLFVCLVIMTLFTGQLFNVEVSFFVAMLFILAMAALIAATGSFLWEIHVAAAMIRVRTDLIEKVRRRRAKKARFWKKIF
ncbi:MAG: DUF2721 domain-containing protein [Henriciella sp.]|uniref:DUF2721 domain-containing protein n=1 Tax=Henriciella sp. TaxID=1968823 RepID=UPI003C7126F4